MGDVVVAITAILIALPLVVVGALAVFASDGRNPFYVSNRIGLRGRQFPLFKLRTMKVGAAQSGVDTTAAGDPRVTAVGAWLRSTKLDELPQLFNVLAGHMSLVGPRPNVPREVQRYTQVERRMLDVRPGLTDYASIVFADLAHAIPPGFDPNLAYNQLVRPIKSRLALHYMRSADPRSDLVLCFCTAAHLFSRRQALRLVASLLRRTGADEDLIARSLRSGPLTPLAPPGASEVVTSLDHEDPYCSSTHA
jgi:lipopolysaccharide/colanic/teichoic acid biosynthesis glycosyltransferase